MVNISKVTNGARIASATAYGLGKNRKLKNNTVEWLKNNHLEQPEALRGTRAFAVGATNDVDPLNPHQMTDLNRMYRQTKERNQCFRIVQSFADSELNAKRPKDWELANQAGVEFAEKMFPNNQAVVYTHVDGENHHIHNHIIVNKVIMDKGTKLSYGPSGPLQEMRDVNDQIARKHYYLQTPKRLEEGRVKQAEKQITEKGGYSWKDYLRNCVDYAQKHTTSWENYEKALNQRGIDIRLRNSERQNITYAMVNQATGKLVSCRANKLVTPDQKRSISFKDRMEGVTKREVEYNLKFNTDDDALKIVAARRNPERPQDGFEFQFSNDAHKVKQASLPMPPRHTKAELVRQQKQLAQQQQQQIQLEIENAKRKKAERALEEEKHGSFDKQKAIDDFNKTNNLTTEQYANYLNQRGYER